MNLDLFQEIMRDDYGQKMTMYDNSRVFTPEKIAKQMVDMLPDQVWDPKTKFLDPCCKTGVFLIEIYNKLDEALQKLPDYSDKSKRRNHILNNQIFGIALDDESLVYSRRNVAGDIFYENIQYLPQFMRFIKDKDYAGIKKLLKQEEVFKMDKFDVVIGNPPYQENTGGGGRNSKGAVVIYNLFMEAALKLSDNTCFIVKNNWLKSEKLKKLRNDLIDVGITDIINYPIYGEVFPEAKVSVCIVKTKRGYMGETHFIQVENNTVKFEYYQKFKNDSIVLEDLTSFKIKNVVESQSAKFLQGVVVGGMPFGIHTNGVVDRDRYIEGKLESQGDYNIRLMFSDKQQIYIREDDFTKNKDLVDHYKVCCGQQLRCDDKVVYNLQMLEPKVITTCSFPIIYQSNSECSTLACYKYIKTKFTRFLIRSMCDSICYMSSSRFSLVPLQDFTSDSDIDWSKSVDEIDKQLYKKYNLTQEEIDYIEKTIKPMK